MGMQADTFREWYSTEIWGKRAQDDDALFEVMSLQIFQAGLTWSMVLARRDAFRKAFQGWEIDAVANIGPPTVELMLKDPSIIRNRKKVEACVHNAGVITELQQTHGSFCGWFYGLSGEGSLQGDELSGLQKQLKATFKFMGPEIARMWLFASGRLVRPDSHHG